MTEHYVQEAQEIISALIADNVSCDLDLNGCAAHGYPEPCPYGRASAWLTEMDERGFRHG